MYKMIKYLILPLLFVAISCQQKEREVELTYDEEKIIAVLIDLYIAAQIIEDARIELKDSLRSVYTDQIGNIHQVEMRLIELHLAKLQLNPKLYEDLHKQVRDSIIVLEKTHKYSK